MNRVNGVNDAIMTNYKQVISKEQHGIKIGVYLQTQANDSKYFVFKFANGQTSILGKTDRLEAAMRIYHDKTSKVTNQ